MPMKTTQLATFEERLAEVVERALEEGAEKDDIEFILNRAAKSAYENQHQAGSSPASGTAPSDGTESQESAEDSAESDGNIRFDTRYDQDSVVPKVDFVLPDGTRMESNILMIPSDPTNPEESPPAPAAIQIWHRGKPSERRRCVADGEEETVKNGRPMVAQHFRKWDNLTESIDSLRGHPMIGDETGKLRAIPYFHVNSDGEPEILRFSGSPGPNVDTKEEIAGDLPIHPDAYHQGKSGATATETEESEESDDDGIIWSQVDQSDSTQDNDSEEVAPSDNPHIVRTPDGDGYLVTDGDQIYGKSATGPIPTNQLGSVEIGGQVPKCSDSGLRPFGTESGAEWGANNYL